VPVSRRSSRERWRRPTWLETEETRQCHGSRRRHWCPVRCYSQPL